MKADKSFLLLIFMIVGGFLGIGYAYSLFSDSAQTTNNVLSASAIFPSATPTITPTPLPVTNTPTPTTPAIANHLVINEVLYDTSTAQNISGAGGSNRGEFAEIYNPTASAVNLTGWTIEDGSSSETLSGTLAAGGRLIITGATEAEFEAIWSVPASTIYVQAGGGTIGNGLANGGDRLVLKNSGSEVDKMSWGTDTTGFSSGCGASCPTSPTGQSLERNPAGVDTDAAGNFVVRNPPAPGN